MYQVEESNQGIIIKKTQVADVLPFTICVWKHNDVCYNPGSFDPAVWVFLCFCHFVLLFIFKSSVLVILLVVLFRYFFTRLPLVSLPSVCLRLYSGESSCAWFPLLLFYSIMFLQPVMIAPSRVPLLHSCIMFLCFLLYSNSPVFFMFGLSCFASRRV